MILKNEQKGKNENQNHLSVGILCGLAALILATSVTFFIPPHPDYRSESQISQLDRRQQINLEVE